MFFKNWPYWLKGGAIGTLIAVISLALIIPLDFLGNSSLNNLFIILCLPLFILAVILYPIEESIFSSFPAVQNIAEDILLIVFGLVFYFIFGAVVGLIYGKVKNRIKR